MKRTIRGSKAYSSRLSRLSRDGHGGRLGARTRNRILSWFGLHHLRANGRTGVRALALVSGIDATQDLVSTDISFKLGPRINASGRLADAALPIDLLLSSDTSECRQIAQELDEMNRERQAIERSIAQQAEARAESEFSDKPGIVLFGEDWHWGVVGIVASRVSRRFHKPCVILGAEERKRRAPTQRGGGRFGRGVPALHRLLGHWGGHPMAAGVSRSGNVGALPIASCKHWRNSIRMDCRKPRWISTLGCSPGPQ